MTVSVFLKDASFTNFISSVNPQPDGLKCLIRPRVSKDITVVNLAFKETDVVENGVVTYFTDYGSNINATNNYTTAVTPTANGEMTLVALMKTPTATSRIMGTYDTSDALGDMLFYTPSSNSLSAYNNGAAESIITTPSLPTTFRVFAGSFKNGQTITGASDNGSIKFDVGGGSADRSTQPGRAVKLGHVYAGAAGDNDIAAFLVWERALSIPDLNEVYEYLVDLYEGKLPLE